MFKIPVWDLLASYSWDSKSFSFAWEVYDGYMDDIRFTSPLEFAIEIVSIDDGVSVIFENLDTTIEYEDISHEIHISKFERTFKSFLDPLDPDDIRPIENTMIDLGPIIREEIIMATHTL
jgi:hypothetical protein